MTPNNVTEQETPSPLVVARPLPPDQISPKAVMLRILGLKSVARRNWKLVIAVMIIGGIGGFIYDMLNKPRPHFVGSIMFNLGGGSAANSFGDLGQLAGAFGLSSGAPDANIFVGDNFLIYAQSRPVVEKTMMQVDTINGKDTLLVNYYIRHSGIRDKEWEDNDSLRSFYFQRAKKPEEYTRLERMAMADIYGRVKGEMSVKQPERKSSFMELGCAMENEQLAAHFLTKHLRTIEEDYQRKQTKKTREMYDLLNARADSIARKLTGTENQLARTIDQNQSVVVAQARITENKLTRNSTFLTTLYYQVLQQADNMRLSLIRETPLFTVIEPVTLPLIYEGGTGYRGIQVGLILSFVLAVIIVFLRETYRSVMREE